MPEIIVRSNGSTEQDANVILHEDVQPEHLASDHHAVQLIERVGWAVNEAKDAEDIGGPTAPGSIHGGVARPPAYRLF
jgi:hypothetical protein